MFGAIVEGRDLIAAVDAIYGMVQYNGFNSRERTAPVWICMGKWIGIRMGKMDRDLILIMK